jgi:hypothetical protein
MKKFLVIAAALLLATPAFADTPFSPNNGVQLGRGTKTASATAGAATLHQLSGSVTSEALSTAAGANYVLTITDNKVAAVDQVFAVISGGTNSAGTPVLMRVVPGNGSIVVTVTNIHATLALSGTLRVTFAVFKN